MALTVPLQAVALEAFTLDFNDSLVEKQFLLIPAIPALTARTARLPQLEALAVVFLALGLGACAFPDWQLGRFRIGTC